MKNLILAFCVLAGAGAAARAEIYNLPLTSTLETAGSSTPFRGADISSAPATDVTFGANDPGWKNLCIQNLDTSKFLACGPDLEVSTQTASNQVGVLIRPMPSSTQPDPPTCFAIVARAPFYCRSSSVTGTTRAGVHRFR